MVVDDEPMSLQNLDCIVHAVFPEAEVTTCSSGEEAWEAAQERTYEMVFTDIVMAKMDGVQLAERLSKKNPNIQILYVTAQSEWKVRKKGIPLERCLYKPIQEADIRSVLKSDLFQMKQGIQKEQPKESVGKKIGSCFWSRFWKRKNGRKTEGGERK
ncbi:MAG: response regulator [Lachnospiraceae bacterium]